MISKVELVMSVTFTHQGICTSRELIKSSLSSEELFIYRHKLLLRIEYIYDINKKEQTTFVVSTKRREQFTSEGLQS